MQIKDSKVKQKREKWRESQKGKKKRRRSRRPLSLFSV